VFTPPCRVGDCVWITAYSEEKFAVSEQQETACMLLLATHPQLACRQSFVAFAPYFPGHGGRLSLLKFRRA
jgi:hypothetical protein